MTRGYGIGARARKRVAKAMVKALIVGLLVPLSVIALCMLAAFLFKGLHAFVRAILMVLFGLAGLGLGTLVTLKILEKLQASLYTKEDEDSDPT